MPSRPICLGIVNRTVAFRGIGTYTLVVLAVLLAFPNGGPPGEGRGTVSYPAVPCTSFDLPTLQLSFYLCTQKTVYNIGETANITEGLTNYGRNTTWVEDGMDLAILARTNVVFSDGVFCGADFGCQLEPLQSSSWVFHWKVTGLGNYAVRGTLKYLGFFHGENFTGYKLASPITIGLKIIIV
jgi:hypothetical protein